MCWQRVLAPLWLLLNVLPPAPLAALVKPPLPIRGWNSYDSVSAGGNASYILQQAAVMEASWLPSSKGGWNWLTIDGGWFSEPVEQWAPTEPKRIDEYGRPIGSKRFTADGDLAALAGSVHSRGLRFGLWFMGGLPAEAVEQDTPIKGTDYTARDLATNTTYCPRWARGWGWEVNHQHPAAQAWFDSLVELWAGWKVDLIKLDCANAEDEDWRHRLDIIRFSQAMQASPQDFVLSLSPGGFSNVSQLLDIRPFVSMARVTDDFWDVWEDYMNEGGGNGWASGASHWDACESANDSGIWALSFQKVQNVRADRARDLVAAVSTSPRDSFWVDLDMLPFGRIGHGPPCPAPYAGVGPGCSRPSRFTPEEERSILTLWMFARSPLLVGGDLRDMGNGTVQTLQNPRVLAMADDIDQSWEVLRRNETGGGGFIAWTATSRSKPAARYFAVFNLAAAARPSTSISAAELGLGAQHGVEVEELWGGTEPRRSPAGSLTVGRLAPHGVWLASVQGHG